MIELVHGESLGIMKGAMRRMERESVDMILTDPPYGMDYKSCWRAVKKFDKVVNDNELGWVDWFIEESWRVLKPNSAFYCFCSWHNVDIFKQALEKKFNLKSIIVWNKGKHGMGDLKGGYAPKHEFILFATKGRVLNRGKRLNDVIDHPTVGVKSLQHPSEKPVGLLEMFIKQHTDAGMTVLDPFMGSGSTGVACKNLGRGFVGIEIEEKYVQLARERVGV